MAALAALWLAGRVAVWISGALPAPLVAGLDLAFLPVLAGQVLGQLVHRPKPQNLLFLLFLGALWTGNLLVHLDWTGQADTLEAGLRMGLLAACAMIAVLGGRITPAFTRNAMKRAGVPERDWPVSVPALDRATLALAVPLPWLAAWWPALAGLVAALLGAVQIVKLARWRGGWTRTQPILWALHLGLGLLAAGLLAWGAATWGLGSEIAALHLLGIGAVGGMTLAVMSRATLGHTGRALVAPRPVAWAYAMMGLAALLRWLGTGVPGDGYRVAMLGSVALWSLAFALFLLSLAPMLTAPVPVQANGSAG